MFSGDLLVEVETKQRSDTLLAFAQIPDHKVTVTPHRSLNTVRKVISEIVLMKCAEETKNISGDGVVSVKRIRFRRNIKDLPKNMSFSPLKSPHFRNL